MDKKLAKLNIIASFSYQAIVILYGLVVPRIVLTTFGSEVNGLVSSLNQFLNYITLLEGGLSGVIMSALYKPLAAGDQAKVSGIIKATEQFFRKLAIIFVTYTLAVAVIYPFIVKSSFSWPYIFSLTLIIGLSLFIQYFFALPYRLLINADQRGYIVYGSLISFNVVNFIFTLLVVKLWPSIHVLKACSVIAFLIQPIVFRQYTKRHYSLDLSVTPDPDAIAQRWDGFGQNIAFFIHSNTDVAVLTFFSTLANVSVYSTYMLVISTVKTLVSAVSNALSPSIGTSLAKATQEENNALFDAYEMGICAVSTFAFTCSALLITPFVQLYTAGIQDADYFQPAFGYLMVAAEALYCFRDPYVNVVYAAGHFKQTAKYAYAEAFLNLAVSILLVWQYGLIGVAIGTLVSMFFRMIAHIVYLRKHILFRPLRKSVKCMVVYGLICIVSILLVQFLVHVEITNYAMWLIAAVFTACIVLAVLVSVLFIAYRGQFTALIKSIMGK